MRFDYVVVGAGLAGLTIAERIAGVMKRMERLPKPRSWML